MNTALRTVVFDRWLTRLKDRRGKARILARIRAAEHGNFGDCRPVGSNVLEMRVHFGPGYRIYICRKDKTVWVVLCGGTKRSQRRDIARAHKMAMTIMDE